MKIVFKTDGLTGDNLKFVESLNAKFAEMPEAATKQEVQDLLNAEFKKIFGKEGAFQVATKDEFTALQKQLVDADDPKSLLSVVKAQGELINELQATGGKKVEKGLREVLSEKINEFKEVIKARTGATEIVIKANVTAIGSGGSVANDMSTATALRLFPDAQFFEIKRGTPFILDFVNVGQRDVPYVIWWDEVAKAGDFAITAEGVMKPLIQYKFDKKSSDYKKSAAYSVVTDEFFDDMAALVTQIKRLGQIDLMNNINANILTDMIAALPGFTYTALNSTVYHADDYAAIGAAIAQIQSLFFTPNVLVINPKDAWNMKLTKDDVGRYQMPPFLFDGKEFEFGAVIVDPRVPAGNFLVGDGTTWNVDFRGDIIIRIGYNGTDFITNQQTIVIERYYFDYISTNRLGAWCYGNFQTIKALIDRATNS